MEEEELEGEELGEDDELEEVKDGVSREYEGSQMKNEGEEEGGKVVPMNEEDDDSEEEEDEEKDKGEGEEEVVVGIDVVGVVGEGVMADECAGVGADVDAIAEVAVAVVDEDASEPIEVEDDEAERIGGN